MAYYRVVFDDSQSAQLRSLASEVSRYESQLYSIANGIDSRDGSMASLRNQVKRVSSELPRISTRLHKEGEVWRESVRIYKKAETEAGARASFVSVADDGSAGVGASDDNASDKPPYTIVATHVPYDNTTTYERVYDDGYRERISEQAFRVEQTRGYQDYTNWGKEPGSISKLDYALISDITNKSHEEAWQYIRENFPDNHPFRQGEFVDKTTANGLDYCVFRIDENHAIVSFGGTQDAGDVWADAQIGAGVTPDQAITARNLIDSLPYGNIMVTGHSLGGYIAADVTINSSKVTQCVTFDAPGRGGALGLGALDSVNNINPKITNYYAEGDNVHKIGIQPGRSYAVDAGDNAYSYSVVGEHDLRNFINAWT